ncbi:hypothetical protein [Microbacterium sp.]|uniref:hypothetical protein n=1 Tax=Microbacterium sp. TaxID=51671 RepID=UPI0028120E03|nr:hypothetical protein [Microbacterium sp.]
MTASSPLPWDLRYDAAQFVAIPKTTDAEAAEAWIAECLDRYGVQVDQSPAGAQQISDTARMLLGNARPGAAQLWFAPPGIYSDVLVNIAVESSAGRPSSEELFAEVEYSTAVDVTPLRTETHGVGYVVRWGVLVGAEAEAEAEADAHAGADAAQGGILVEHWTVLLNDGTWTILMDVLGTTLPVFLLFEQQLPQLILGITVPKPVTV